jgi:AcrR family transcriptional regulator
MAEPERVRSRPHTKAPASQRRAEILAAALQCFAEKGYHATTMDDLVAASGLSKGSLYWHFRSKEQVFLLLFDDLERETLSLWDSLIAADRPTVEVVRIVAGRITEHFVDRASLGAWIEFLAHPLARRRMCDLYRVTRGRIADSLERERAQGRVRELDPAGAAAAIVGALEGMLLQAMVDEDFDLVAHLPAALDLIERGVRP